MNEQQRLFADTWLTNGFNATQAAITAGYSKKTAYSQGQRLLKHVEVSVYIKKKVRHILGERDWAIFKLVNDLDSMIDTDIGDFVRIETEEKTEYDEEGNEVVRRYQRVVFSDTENLDTKNIQEIAQTQHGLRIKTYDRQKAIELKGRFLDMWQEGGEYKDKKESEGSNLSREERQRKILEYQNRLGYGKERKA